MTIQPTSTKQTLLPRPCPVCRRRFRNNAGLGGHVHGYVDALHVEYRLDHGLPALHCTPPHPWEVIA